MSSVLRAAIIAIFVMTYVLIATRRLRLLPIGRPAGALLGAVLMVAIGAMKPSEAYAAISSDTLLLLFAAMLLSAYLEDTGFFAQLTAWVLRRSETPWRLLVAVSVVSATLSSVLLNDAVCLFLTPVVVATCARARLPMGPYLLALATSANIGSAATLVGNPQNMLIGAMSHLDFTEFFVRSAPAAALGLGANLVLLRLYFARQLPERLLALPEQPQTQRPALLWLARLVLPALVAAYFLGAHLGFATLAATMVFLLVDREEPREIFGRLDWPVLVFFCCLFVVTAGFLKTGLFERAWSLSAEHIALSEPAGTARFTLLMTLASNLFSNVPTVLVVGPYLPHGDPWPWVLLAFTTTIAGNLTLLGSVANIIVAERAREHYLLGFGEYLRFGLVSTAVVMTLGVTVLYLTN